MSTPLILLQLIRCLNVFWWVKFRKEKGAIKSHTQFDVKANIPTFIDITDGLTHDVNFLDSIIYEAGAFYIADKVNYIDILNRFVRPLYCSLKATNANELTVCYIN